MPKIHNHKDQAVDSEFDNVYQVMVKQTVSAKAPNNPRSGDFWLDPDNQLLYIYVNTQAGWIQLN